MPNGDKLGSFPTAFPQEAQVSMCPKNECIENSPPVVVSIDGEEYHWFRNLGRRVPLCSNKALPLAGCLTSS